MVIETNVLQNSTESNRIVDFRLFLGWKANTLRIAAALHVENTFVCPDMLVISDQLSISHSA